LNQKHINYLSCENLASKHNVKVEDIKKIKRFKGKNLSSESILMQMNHRGGTISANQVEAVKTAEKKASRGLSDIQILLSLTEGKKLDIQQGIIKNVRNS
jgi:hypothetical protein